MKLVNKENSFIKKLQSKRVNDIIFISIMMGIPILHFCVFNIGIHFKTILMSFQTRDELINDYVFIKGDLFANYKEIIQAFFAEGGGLGPALRNSFTLFLLNDLVMIPSSLLMSYFFFKKIPMERFFRVVFYMPSIISVVVMIMVYRFMFDSTIGFVDNLIIRLGFEDKLPEFGWFGTEKTAWSMVIMYCIWAGLGGNIVVISGGMARVPAEVLESARLDGIGFWRELFDIIIPLIGTTLGTQLLLGVQVVFTYFLPVMLLTNGGPNEATMVLPLYVTKLLTTGAGDLSGSAALGMFIALIGTPVVVAARILIDKLLPSYEY